MKQTLIARGAEAILTKEGGNLVKDRIKKSYRLAILDNKLRTSRTKREAKLLEKASSLINVPTVLATDDKEKITMQFIEGKKLSDYLDNLKNAEEVCEEIGKNTAKLHDADIIHGDLTTSNMILVENSKGITPKYKESPHKKSDLLINDKNNISSVSEHSSSEAKPSELVRQNLSYNSEQVREKSESKRTELASEKSENFKVFFIDFGLGFNSRRIEDKAVDLHLLRQALEAKHFSNWENLSSAVLRGYNSKDKTKILEQLKKVESRGRYKKGV